MDSGLAALRRPGTTEKIQHNQQNCSTGKSLLIFGNDVKP